MRKIIVLQFMTLDGVIQAPGGPEEDLSGGFAFGGWIPPYADEVSGKILKEQFGQPFDLLLGRTTFENWAEHWPSQNGGDNPFNKATKYVASNTLTDHPWEGSVFLSGDVAGKVRELKQQEGPDLQVYGSSVLLQTLMQHDLVDEYWLKIYPITLGQGKRLFQEGTMPAAFTLFESTVSPSGVIFASYKRAGDVKTGSFG
ncbi:dihydrofolate reductase [bacterium]|nr:MAG: dihydrofolate reductase [bacterium]